MKETRHRRLHCKWMILCWFARKRKTSYQHHTILFPMRWNRVKVRWLSQDKEITKMTRNRFFLQENKQDMWLGSEEVLQRESWWWWFGAWWCNSGDRTSTDSWATRCSKQWQWTGRCATTWPQTFTPTSCRQPAHLNDFVSVYRIRSL